MIEDGAKKRSRVGVYTTLGANNHSEHDYEENGFYATDPIAIDKLKKVFDIPHHIYEPMCGAGHLSKRLIEYGHDVYSTDLFDRGFGEETGVDFFEVKEIDPKYSILTNPPYTMAMDSVLHAIDLVSEGNYVIMFLKVQFLEGKKRREHLFNKYNPKFVFVSSERIYCALNGDFSKKNNSAVAYAWFIWEKGWTGDTVVRWM